MAPAIPDLLTFSSESDSDPPELESPFGKLDIDKDDLRETAYEIFFTACRSSPGFGGRSPLVYIPAPENGEGVVKVGLGSVAMNSRIKRTLGLRTKRASPKRATGSHVPLPPSPRPKRPFTAAELMRQQMRISEQNDSRLRKALMRFYVGQMGKRAETILLPVELLRQLRPSEFMDPTEYHLWQKRQISILEVGLLQHPLIPLEKSNPHANKLREIVRAAESKPIDIGKFSGTMATLYNSAINLAWRTSSNSQTEVPCHWVDGYPLNIHLYISLLQSCFDLRDETFIIDEVDEIMDLMKKTWISLGVDKLIHNICFTWVLFEQFVVTGQVEQDLLGAALAMLTEVSNDAKRASGEVMYVRILDPTLMAMQSWAERWLLDYHEMFWKGGVALMESVLPLALSAAQIRHGNVLVDLEKMDTTANKVDTYIRSSSKNTFKRLLESGAKSTMGSDDEETPGEALVSLAKETEALAMREKESFSPMLKRWHPVAAAVAAATLHNCYGAELKQYVNSISTFTEEAIRVLQGAGKLEKFLVQMAVEDSVDCEDGGKGIIREMVPYDSESIMHVLMKNWIQERMQMVRECLDRAKETETWKPKSKSEPYAQSVVDLTKMAKEMVHDLFAIPTTLFDDLVQELSDGLENIFQDYTSFIAACGTKQSYIPPLPPLTRRTQYSKLRKAWRKATPCQHGDAGHSTNPSGGDVSFDPRPSTSRGTQRLYIRLNTLHYLLSHLNALQKSLSASSRPLLTPRHPKSHRRRTSSSSSSSISSSSSFDLARSSIQSSTLHISEVAAFRLIFLDSNVFFYDSLYADGGVANSRIHPALRSLKQNIALLSSIVTDRVQPLAVTEIMKASFEAFAMVLLAGGWTRAFVRSDAAMVADDFRCLKQLFCGEGLMVETVEAAAAAVDGVVELMGQETEQLMENFSMSACEASGLGLGFGNKIPMPPTTGRWDRTDPNTILRVLCYRNDAAANRFLKRSFQLPKRR